MMARRFSSLLERFGEAPPLTTGAYIFRGSSPLRMFSAQLTNVEREKPITDTDSSFDKSFMDHLYRVSTVERCFDLWPYQANETDKLLWLLAAKADKDAGQILPSHVPPSLRIEARKRL